MTAILKNFIGGEWVDGSDFTKKINPSNTNDVVGQYGSADEAQTAKAIAAAKAAFPRLGALANLQHCSPATCDS